MKLYVILPISNPCGFQRRRQLFNECLARLLKETNPNLEIIVSEMVYGWTPGVTITKCNGYTHIVSTGIDILWCKENLINTAIKYILAQLRSNGEGKSLPAVISWIDADVIFKNINWIQDTLAVFQQANAAGIGLFVQLFTHASFLTPTNSIEYTVASFCNQYVRGKRYNDYHNRHDDYWHPGFAWAMDSETVKKMMAELGYVLPEHTVGGADRHMALAAANFTDIPSPYMTLEYLDMLDRWRQAYHRTGCQLGVIQGSIHHCYHGTMANRKYVERNTLLAKFVPNVTTRLDEHGIVQWFQASNELRLGMINYFRERYEDDIYVILGISHSHKTSWADKMADRLQMYVNDAPAAPAPAPARAAPAPVAPAAAPAPVPTAPAPPGKPLANDDSMSGLMFQLVSAIETAKSIVAREQQFANDLSGYC